MVKLAVIGAGQLGSRHLQALSLIDREASIQVVDPISTSLEIAKTRFSEVCGSGNVRGVTYLNRISDLWDELDLVVVATNADVRMAVVEELLSLKKVRYIILEKVLFQKLDDYDVVGDLLTQKNVKAWVNCPKRVWPFYRELKEKFNGVERIDYTVSGSDLGIGCNAIHYIDNLAYLTGQIKFTLFNDQLDPETIPSKRQGFIEFTGTLYGYTEKRSRITITSYHGGDVPPLVQISSDSVRCLIMENQDKALISDKKDSWSWQEIKFTSPYQSQLTHMVVQKILNTGKCDLPNFEESSSLHTPLLEALTTHLKKKVSEEIEICPIT